MLVNSRQCENYNKTHQYNESWNRGIDDVEQADTMFLLAKDQRSLRH
jgi:hypothetical protein